MKHFLSIVFILGATISSFSQHEESYFTQYKLKNKITFKSDETIYLQKDSIVKFSALPKKQQEAYLNWIKNDSVVEYQIEKTIGSSKIVLFEKLDISSKNKIDYDELFKNHVFTIPVNVSLSQNRKGYVKFVKNKIYVNPHLTKDDDNKYNRDVYYYKLKNRQTVYLNFTEFNVSGITIPLKYRLKGKVKGKDLPEKFSTSFNANLFLGYTFWGKTSFTNRLKVDNRSNTFKTTFGVFVGAATVELNNGNTELSDDPIPDGTSFTEGLASWGVGLTTSFNKVNFGVFAGWDYSIGNNSDKWDYNKKTWLGFAIGYSLFNL